MIASFTKKQFYLSNFYVCDIEDVITYKGKPKVLHFKSSEALFQSFKCKTPEGRIKFAGDITPNHSKRLGRSVEIREDWEKVKINFMRYTLNLKFGQNPELLSKLLETGDEELVEGNDWGDKFWGVCDGVGENHLGKLLMELRNNARVNPSFYSNFKNQYNLTNHK